MRRKGGPQPTSFAQTFPLGAPPAVGSSYGWPLGPPGSKVEGVGQPRGGAGCPDDSHILQVSGGPTVARGLRTVDSGDAPGVFRPKPGPLPEGYPQMK